VLVAGIVVLILAAGVFSGGLLLYLMVGGGWAVWRATARANESLERELAGLSTEELRERLLTDPYLSEHREDAGVRELLSRIARGDELALAREYPRRSLYEVLVRAETAAGHTGRPEAVDAVPEISSMLQELARRRVGGP
jgi:hypothetical protein